MEIEFFAWGGAVDDPAWIALADAYMEANPNVTVAVSPTPGGDEYYQKLQTLFAGGTPAQAQATSVLQGTTERSNVTGVAEMTEMIRVTRAYTSLADLMQRQDELRRSAIQRLGDMQA